MKKKKIYSTDDFGNKIEYDVILTFKNEDNNKDYIIYTDNTYDENNKLVIFSAVYNPDTLEFLGNPETEEEWIKIHELLDKVIQEG